MQRQRQMHHRPTRCNKSSVFKAETDIDHWGLHSPYKPGRVDHWLMSTRFAGS